jgi:hypothetical protein
MGVFDDHKLGQLDWMTQMTETIDSDLNALLAKLPDRTLISAKKIIESGGSSYLSLSVSTIVVEAISQIDKNLTLTWDEQASITGCFKFEIVGEPELDLKTGILSGGEIAMVKHVQTFSDEQLQPLMGKRGIDVLGRSRDYNSDNGQVERANEILDILGNCAGELKHRSFRRKISSIKNRLHQIFTTNEWRVRDMNLANKVGYWIKDYIERGTLSGLTNLYKLKVMTHNNMPIYSIKEEQ